MKALRLVLLLRSLTLIQPQLFATAYFTITVIDAQTGRGVPLVELKTVSNATWWTDSNGIAVVDEPGLIDHETYFFARSDGYEYPKDFFGFRGTKLNPVAGGSATIKLKRKNIAERLYRITGEGIYRDSVLAGHPTPIKQPLLNGQVAGQDTVITAIYRGKIYWFWGDTERIGFPLGNFGASGAVSDLPTEGGLDPSVGIDLKYFVDKVGFSKPMCLLPGKGLRWIEGVLTVTNELGKELLVARVANVRNLDEVNDWHLMVFNDQKEEFESVRRWDIKDPHDSAHPFRATVRGEEWWYLYPNWRVKPDLRSLSELTNYQALTCIAGDGKIHDKDTKMDRDPGGQVRYSWKAGADRLSSGRIHELVRLGKLKPGESWLALHDFESGSPIEADRGSVFWNDFRKRWVMITSRHPIAGEIWFAEADTPSGPWVYARRLLSHENYNFYNPTQHPLFDQQGGRLIYFEGTYTAAFSGAKNKTPRYDYNQVMYRLDLNDSRLALPAPVYDARTTDGRRRCLLGEQIEAKERPSVEAVAFYAIPPARSRPGLVPIFSDTENGIQRLDTRTNKSGKQAPLFFALPGTNSSSGVAGLWNCKAKFPDGSELPFQIELSQEGAKIKVEEKESGSAGTGSLENGRITLQMRLGNRSFLLSGILTEQTLAGDWKELNDEPHGTWSAKWIDQTPEEYRSQAVVPLYEYATAAGDRFYSTDPGLKRPELTLKPEPLCRVWRNPMATLVLDAEVQPVPFGTTNGPARLPWERRPG